MKFKGFFYSGLYISKGFCFCLTLGGNAAGYLNRSTREIRQDSFSKTCFRIGGVYLSIVIF